MYIYIYTYIYIYNIYIIYNTYIYIYMMETHDYTTGIIIYIYMINQCVPCGNQMWLAGKSPLPMEVSFAGRNIDFFSGFSGKLWNDTGGESHYDPMEFHEIP